MDPTESHHRFEPLEESLAQGSSPLQVVRAEEGEVLCLGRRQLELRIDTFSEEEEEEEERRRRRRKRRRRRRRRRRKKKEKKKKEKKKEKDKEKDKENEKEKEKEMEVWFNSFAAVCPGGAGGSVDVY